jgi:hypothetical protein
MLRRWVATLRGMGGNVEGDGWLSLREMGSNPNISPKKWKNGRHKGLVNTP